MCQNGIFFERADGNALTTHTVKESLSKHYDTNIETVKERQRVENTRSSGGGR